MKNFKRFSQNTKPRPCSPHTPFLVAAVCSALFTMAAVVAPAQTLEVRLLLPASNSSLPLLLIAEEDPIPGVDVRAQLYQNHAQALALLLRGEAQLLLTGTSQGWENYLSGSPLEMIGTGVWGVSFLIGSKDCPPIESITDLAGKSIALPFPGSPLDFQTRFLLQHYGIKADRDLKLIYSPPPQTAALLLKGQIDAAPLPEPLASQLVISQGLQRFLDYKQVWASTHGGDPKSPQVSLFTTRAFAAGNAELLQELVVAWREASEQIVKDPHEAARMFCELLGFSQAVIAQSIPNTLFCVPSPEENRDRVRAYYEAVRGFLPGKRGELEEDFFFCPEP
jgi:NitT/TauT family transport system substrate-binding protein